MTIYDELVQKVSDGDTFYINFKNRSMKIGKKFIITDGVYNDERKLIEYDYSNTEEILNKIESLYADYKYSLPSERSDSKRRKYFKALSMEELTDKQLIVAQRREVAQAKLEGFILCTVLNGQFKWSNEMGKWFWECKNDSDLVLLRRWIDGQ